MIPHHNLSFILILLATSLVAPDHNPEEVIASIPDYVDRSFGDYLSFGVRQLGCHLVSGEREEGFCVAVAPLHIRKVNVCASNYGIIFDMHTFQTR